MISLPLKQVSQAGKLTALETTWKDLSRDEERFESPAWHQAELAATEERVQAGKEQFVAWERAKKTLRERFE